MKNQTTQIDLLKRSTGIISSFLALALIASGFLAGPASTVNAQTSPGATATYTSYGSTLDISIGAGYLSSVYSDSWCDVVAGCGSIYGGHESREITFAIFVWQNGSCLNYSEFSPSCSPLYQENLPTNSPTGDVWAQNHNTTIPYTPGTCVEVAWYQQLYDYEVGYSGTHATLATNYASLFEYCSSTPTASVAPGTTNLAIYDNPSVVFRVTDPNTGQSGTSANLTVGQSANITWQPTATDNGNFCQATSSVPSWNGMLQSTPGTTYNQSTGVMNTQGVYPLTVTCRGGPAGSPVWSAPQTIIVNVGQAPNYTLVCAPLATTIFAGSTTSFTLTTAAQNGFNSPVNFVVDSISPNPSTAPNIAFSNNNTTPAAVTTANVSTQSNTSTGTFTINFKGTGGGIERRCTVELTIRSTTPLAQPQNVAIAPRGCGQVEVSWNNPNSAVHPETFNVYRRTNPTGAWSIDPNGTGIPYSNVQSDPEYVYIDTAPLNVNRSNYYSVRAVYSGVESAGAVSYPLSVIPTTCGPDLSLSDKDITAVQGAITKSFPAVACSGVSEPAVLPNNAIFSVGDIITFHLNVCNSGSGPLDNILVRDTLYNLSSPSGFTSSPAGCMTSHTVSGSNIDFRVANIAAAPPTKYCTIIFKAVVTSPNPQANRIFRFQNVADITGNGASAHVFTPPYPFSNDGRVPDRNETGPQ